MDVNFSKKRSSLSDSPFEDYMGTGVKTLPPEILSIIFQYLTEKDISRCSRVCIRWREETNRNEVWKRFCIQKQWAEVFHAREPGILSRIPLHVEPYFHSPEPNQNTGLSPLCAWYIDFLQYSHLYGNWRNGRYFIEEFNESIQETLGDVTAMDLNHRLLVLGCDNGIITIWKFTQRGPKLLEKVPCVFKDAEISHVFLEGVSFAVIQLGLLQVYHKRNGVYSLSYVKAMISQDIALPDLVTLWPSQRSYDEWFVENVYDHFNDEKFRYARSCDTTIIAFWGSIVGIEVLSQELPSHEPKILHLPYENYTVRDICVHDFLLYILLSFTMLPCIVLKYCLEKDVCIKLIEDTSDLLHLRVGLNFLVSMDKSGSFSIWHSKNAEKLHVIQPCGQTSSSDYEVFGNSVLYHSDKIVGSIHNCTGHIVINQFDIEVPATFLSEGLGDFFVVRSKKDIEIWSREEKQRLYQIKNILIEGLPYTVQCCDSCIVLWGFNLTPKFIWFW